MEASIGDVAKQAGVSTATVSRAFSHPERVSPKTRERVLAAAETMNFGISRTAGILKSGRSYRIALLVGSGKLEWFTACIVEGLNEVFHAAGYDLALYPIGDLDERAAFFEDLPVRGNADAVIVSSFDIEPGEIERLASAHIPLVGINVAHTESLTASVGIDDIAGMQRLVRHLVKMGHRRIAYQFVAFHSALSFSSAIRLEGFRRACAEFPDVSGQVLRAESDEQSFDMTMDALFSTPTPPTAICFHQDSQAIPLLYRLPRYGVQVPRDLSITGFDDSLFAAEVGLTTIHQDPKAMAELAARKTLDLIEDRPLAQPHETFPIDLVVRDTTAAPL